MEVICNNPAGVQALAPIAENSEYLQKKNRNNLYYLARNYLHWHKSAMALAQGDQQLFNRCLEDLEGIWLEEQEARTQWTERYQLEQATSDHIAVFQILVMALRAGFKLPDHPLHFNIYSQEWLEAFANAHRP